MGLSPDLGLAVAIGVWLFVLALSLAQRPLLPIDETRYLSVAWEMWLRDSWLVPYLNDATYSSKPPMLFWLINIAWTITGVSETVGRAVPTLFVPLSALLTVWLARLLWPERPGAAGASAVLLAGSFLFLVSSSLVMFDAMLTACVLLGFVGVVQVWRSGRWLWWLLVGLAIGLGVLVKGPVILVHLLPAALLAPLWQGHRPFGWWLRWFAGLLGALLLGAGLALAWALPAAEAGGQAYGDQILWSQFAGRVSKSFDHARPWWFFLPILPAAFFPWLWWQPVWRAVGGLRAHLADPGLRLTLLWSALVLILFSMISGKQAHYLLPMVPPVALWLGRLLDDHSSGGRWTLALPFGLPLLVALGGLALPWLVPMLQESYPDVQPPLWLVELSTEAWIAVILCLATLWLVAALAPKLRLTALTVMAAALFAVGQGAGHGLAYAHFDLRPIARMLAVHDDGPIAMAGLYQGEFGFLGRLQRPLETVAWKQADAWLAANPQGLMVIRNKGSEPIALQGERRFVMPYRDRWISVWSGR